MILGLRVAFLFLAVWFSCINLYRGYCQISTRPRNFILQAIGIVGFIAMMGWLNN